MRRFILISIFTISPILLGATTDHQGVLLDFEDVDIRTFIKAVSEITGRNFIIDPQVKGTVTIICPESVPKDAVLSIFESVLNVNGFGSITGDNITKIVPLRDIRSQGLKTFTDAEKVKGISRDEFISKIFSLKYIDVEEAIDLIRPMLSKDGAFASHIPTNTLILSDCAANIDRISKIFSQVDIEGSSSGIWVLELKYGDAEAISNELSAIFKSEAGTAPITTKPPAMGRTRPISNVKIVPDRRTNSLIVVASADQFSQIKEMVQKLDVEAPKSQARANVYYLQNADAEELAKVLTEQVSKSEQEKALNKPGSSLFEGRVAITADKATNALVINASPSDFAIILEVIKKLDVPRHQVFVEGLIAEISAEKTHELGVEWRITDQPQEGSTRPFGGTNLPTTDTGLISQAATGPQGFPSGLVLGVVKGTITYNNQEFLNLGALIRAFRGDSDVNILSTPHLLTMDNEEAEIIVGEQRPFLKSAQTTSDASIIRTYDYKDIGLTLRITPHISNERFVKLKIEQEVKDFIEQVEVGAITTTNRQAKTTVLVEDGQTVVIGGLMRDNKKGIGTYVPCLGKIPVFGSLFRNIKTQSKKTNLIIFITPHIIRNPEALKQITDRKDQQMQMSLEESEKSAGEEIKEDIQPLIE